MAGHVGERAPLSALLFDGPHALERQAYAPRELLSGTVCVDGTGVAWWEEVGDAPPLHYASERPPWSDPNLKGRDGAPGLAARLGGRLILAAVRSTTPGMPHGTDAVAPLVADGLALTHNGFVEDFARAVRPAALRGLPDAVLARLRCGSDSEVLLLEVLRARLDAPGAGPAAWLAEAQRSLAEHCEAAGVGARLDALLADGRALAAGRRGVGLEPNSLYARRLDDGGHRVASEPLDDEPGWELLPAGAPLLLEPDPRPAVTP